ncbi:hypothetical protein PBY51_010907 [Eleginops maclovinus]|uniref:Uncharacterized protein n=1 Tax=Eleginops maclovinus TaxID=56733 RepID=A0AAN7XDJ7_ELEMC|nr:hypothetical protein PBY51_010907 [Eleginops maclovinus]
MDVASARISPVSKERLCSYRRAGGSRIESGLFKSFVFSLNLPPLSPFQPVGLAFVSGSSDGRRALTVFTVPRYTDVQLFGSEQRNTLYSAPPPYGVALRIRVT